MSEYWVSQAKKQCDFCKCWIADNKPSRDFHERGKRHQENVKKKIEEVRKKSVLKAQQDQDMSDSLREMEENALRALKRDLIKNPAMASQYGVKLKPKDPPKEYGPEPRPQSSTAEEDEESDTPEKETEKDEEPAATTVGVWHMTVSEQGYPYYWNDITSEVSWVPPPAYLEQQEEAASATAGEVELEEDNKSSSSSASEEEQSEKELDPVPTVSTPEESVPKRPLHEDPVKRPKQPQPRMYKLKEPSCKKPKMEAPGLVANIPLPGDISLPSPPGTEVLVNEAKVEKEEAEEEEDSPDESRQHVESTRHAKSHAAYGTWEQVQEEQQPEDVDFGLPEVMDKGEPFITVPVAEPRFKVREKTVSSLGSGPVFFKKPKKKFTAAQFLKKREET